MSIALIFGFMRFRVRINLECNYIYKGVHTHHSLKARFRVRDSSLYTGE